MEKEWSPMPISYPHQLTVKVMIQILPLYAPSHPFNSVTKILLLSCALVFQHFLS